MGPKWASLEGCGIHRKIAKNVISMELQRLAGKLQPQQVSGPSLTHKIHEKSPKKWDSHLTSNFNFLCFSEKLTFMNFKLILLTIIDVLSKSETTLSYVN
jgi:hypothetical protein